MPSKSKILSLVLCTFLCFFSSLSGHTYKLAVCCIFKNNTPWLKEWIEYYRLQGVEHFYLYDNGSTDNPRKFLKNYIQNGLVTLVDWPNCNPDKWGKKVYAWVYSTQQTAYKDAVRRAKNEAEWLAFFDTDEFCLSMHHDKMTEYLDEMPADVPGVTIAWKVYGTSNVYDIPPDKLMIEMLTYRCPDDHFMNTFTKVIVRPEEFFDFYWVPHVCVFNGGSHGHFPHPDEIRINHYMTRTVKFTLEEKSKAKESMDNVAKGTYSPGYWLNLGNDVEDQVMDRFIPRLRARMGLAENPKEKMTLDDLAELIPTSE